MSSSRPKGRISIRTTGGLAHFPGTAQERTIDLGQLAGDDAAVVDEAVKNAAFFDRPDQSATRPAHDARTHYVTIEMDGRVRSLVIAEPANDQALSDLVRIVRRLVIEDAPRRDGI